MALRAATENEHRSIANMAEAPGANGKGKRDGNDEENCAEEQTRRASSGPPARERRRPKACKLLIRTVFAS